MCGKGNHRGGVSTEQSIAKNVDEPEKDVGEDGRGWKSPKGRPRE
jgi:hypothetical protein